MSVIECSALLFDLDGVLIDSTPAVTRVWQRWAREHELDPEEVVMRAHGRPSISTVRHYLPEADHEAENGIVERREIEDLDGVVPLPGARELLAKLPKNRWTIVTSCTRALAEVRLRAAGLQLPPRFITSSDIKNGKPHPEPYIKAAGLLGVPAGECVVVEDAPAGIRSGREAGARVIGVRTTVNESELRMSGATWILENCADISVVKANGELALELKDGNRFSSIG